MPFLGRVDADQATFVAGGAIPMHAIVKLESTGKVALAASGDASIGHAMRSAAADGDEIAVRLHAAPSQEAIASGAVTVGAAVFQGANGEVATTGTVALGIAITAAAAADELIVYVSQRTA